MTIKSTLTSLLLLFLTMVQAVWSFCRVPQLLQAHQHLGQRLALGLQSKTTRQVATMCSLPDGVVQYSQVPSPKKPPFTTETIPRGLLREHTTKAGTWGVIRIQSGRLEYTITEPNKTVYVLDSNTPGVIEPQVKHQVKALTDDLAFVVEFYRFPGTGPVMEQRE